MNPVTHFWDARVLGVYCLLGGYTSLTSEEILKLTDSEADFKYLIRVLVRLESAEKILVTNIKNGNSLVKHNKLSKIVSPNPSWFSSKDHGKLTFEITANDTNWFHEVVAEYLNLFKANQLYAALGLQPTSYAKQRKMLLQLLQDRDGKQTVREEFNGLGVTFKALETALTLSAEEVINIYDLTMQLGMNNTDIPLTQLQIALVDEDYEDDYNSNHNNLITDKTWLAELKVNGRRIEARIQGEPWQLIYNLRAEGGLYNFMHYMQNHTNTNVGRSDIQLLEGCESYLDMTEVTRRCGFNSKLKKYFFNGTTRLNARLNNPVSISADEREELSSILAHR
jgi:hypothetical protein